MAKSKTKLELMIYMKDTEKDKILASSAVEVEYDGSVRGCEVIEEEIERISDDLSDLVYTALGKIKNVELNVIEEGK